MSDNEDFVSSSEGEIMQYISNIDLNNFPNPCNFVPLEYFNIYTQAERRNRQNYNKIYKFYIAHKARSNVELF